MTVANKAGHGMNYHEHCMSIRGGCSLDAVSRNIRSTSPPLQLMLACDGKKSHDDENAPPCAPVSA